MVVRHLVSSFAATASLLALLVGPAAAASIDHDSRIINGVGATADYGFVVALLSADALDGGRPYDSQFCGGILTSPTTVVTAAHCVVDDGASVASSPKDLVVGFGRDLDKPMRLVKLSAVSANPAYLLDDYAADIAVLTLATPVTDVAPLAPVTPAEAVALTAGGSPASAVGWGNTSASSEKYPTVLREGAMVVFPVSACGRGRDYTVSGVTFEGWSRPDVDPAVMLCATGVSGGKQVDTCQGDSGGPLISGTGATARLIGVTSFGDGCASGSPSVFARVSATYDFLVAHAAAAPLTPSTGAPLLPPDPGVIVRHAQVRRHQVYFRVSAASGNGWTISAWRVICTSTTGDVRSGRVSVAGIGGDAWVSGLSRGSHLCAVSASSAIAIGVSVSVPVQVTR